MTELNGCICEGNWRNIVKETETLIGKSFRDIHGHEYRLFGIVHGEDDYYYGMYSKEHGMMLLSCVGNLDSWQFIVCADSHEQTEQLGRGHIPPGQSSEDGA